MEAYLTVEFLSTGINVVPIDAHGLVIWYLDSENIQILILLETLVILVIFKIIVNVMKAINYIL